MIIRKPNLENTSPDGIPLDFAQVRDYFNWALRERKFQYTPRKTPITDDEIKKLWLPSANTNINLLVELEGRVVAQLTVFYDVYSTAYEYKAGRKIGSIGSSFDPRVSLKKVAPPLLKKTIEELRKRKQTATLTIPKENPISRLIESLGYRPERLTDQQRYKDVGLSGDVLKYTFP